MLRGMLFVAAVAASAILAQPGSARADGSVAYRGDGRVGISYDFNSPRDADYKALRECGPDCRIVGRFRGACAAIAVGRRGGYGWAYRGEQRFADRVAMETCEREGAEGCHIAITACDG